MPAPDLVTAELTLTGRITTASNATFLGRIGGAAMVYKPIAGEQPLWDFPDECLAVWTTGSLSTATTSCEPCCEAGAARR